MSELNERIAASGQPVVYASWVLSYLAVKYPAETQAAMDDADRCIALEDPEETP